MEFPAKLRKLVAWRGTNQSQVGRETGLKQSTISAMMRGSRRPYLDQGLAIARVLGVSLDYLADDTLDEVPAPEFSDWERELISLLRASGLTREDVLRRLMVGPFTITVPDPDHPALLAARERLAGGKPPKPNHNAG